LSRLSKASEETYGHKPPKCHQSYRENEEFSISVKGIRQIEKEALI
jgi:hypothetical protein